MISSCISGPVKRKNNNKHYINRKILKDSENSSNSNNNDNHNKAINLEGVVKTIDQLLQDPSMKDFYRLRIKSFPSLIIPFFNAINNKNELDFNTFSIMDCYDNYSVVFRRLEKLRSLNLSGCYLGDRDYNLTNFLSLEKLDISNNCITNNGFKNLCNSLYLLSPIKSINLSYNNFNIQSAASLRRIMSSFQTLEEFIFIIDACDYYERDYKQNDWSNLFNDFSLIIMKLRYIKVLRIKGLNYVFKTEGLKSIVDSITSPVLKVLELDNFAGTLYNPFNCIDISFLKIMGMNSLEELSLTRVNLDTYISNLLRSVRSLHSLKVLILDIEGEYEKLEKELKSFVKYLSENKNLTVLKLSEIFLCNDLVNMYEQIEKSTVLVDIDLPLYNLSPPRSLKKWKTNYSLRNIQGLYDLEELHLLGRLESNFNINNILNEFCKMEDLKILHLDFRECSNFEFAGVLYCIKNTLKELKIEALCSFKDLFDYVSECVNLENKIDSSVFVDKIKYLPYLQEIIINHCDMDSKKISSFFAEIGKVLLFEENTFISLRSLDLRDNIYTKENILSSISEYIFEKIKYLNLTHLAIEETDLEQRDSLILHNNIEHLQNYNKLGVYPINPSSVRLNRKGMPIEKYYLLKTYGTIVVISDDQNLS